MKHVDRNLKASAGSEGKRREPASLPVRDEAGGLVTAAIRCFLSVKCKGETAPPAGDLLKRPKPNRRPRKRLLTTRSRDKAAGPKPTCRERQLPVCMWRPVRGRDPGCPGRRGQALPRTHESAGDSGGCWGTLSEAQEAEDGAGAGRPLPGATRPPVTWHMLDPGLAASPRT